MTTDLAFHFPPDVFDAVVDAVPLLTQSKRDVAFRVAIRDGEADIAGADDPPTR
jgi:hypothetical protein